MAADIPASLALVIFGMVLAAQAFAVPSVRLLGVPWQARLFLALAASLVLVRAIASGTRKRLVERSELPVILPGAFLSLLGIAASWLPLERGSEWYLTRGSDNLSHIILTLQRREDGYLSYAENAYPGAWHTAMALITSVSGKSTPADSETLEQFVHIFPQAMWLLYAVLSVAVGLLARLYAIKVGFRPVGAGLIASTAAVTMLGGQFLGFTMPYGFQTHILVSIAMVVALSEVMIQGQSPARAAGIVTVCCALAIHSWTLGVIFLAVPWCVAMIRFRRAVPVRSPGGLLVLIAAVVSVASVSPALFTVLRGVGIGKMAAEGAADPLPSLWIISGVLAAAALAKLKRLGFVPIVTLAFGGACSFAMSRRVGVPLESYYPTKMLWLAAVLAVPAVVVAVACLLSSILARLPIMPRRVLTFTMAIAVPLLLAVNVAFATLLVFSGAKKGDASKVLAAATSPEAQHAQVVWGASDKPVLDAFVRMLLDFYAAQEPATPAAVLSVAEECELLRAAHDPAVLTTRAPEEVSAKYDCVPHVRTIPIVTGR